MTTFYRLLGVTADSDGAAIKSAYRALARKYHPDHNGGHPLAERRFRMLAEAYDVLSDDAKRVKYDRYGVTALSRQGDLPGFAGSVQRLAKNLETALESRLKGVKRRGADKRLPLALTLREAVFGCTKQVVVIRRGPCDSCGGGGAERGSAVEACHVCDGRGLLREGSGLLAREEACAFCDGRGRVALRPCDACHGAGEAERHLELPVTVPPAAHPGRRLVLRGYGENGQAGGEAGDLFVELSVEPHPLFEREGTDLRVSVPITITEAVLGGQAEVPLLEGGSIGVRVPPGTRGSQVLRLRGRGGPLDKGGRGDLLVRIEIETPVVDSSVARELLERLDQVSIHPHRNAYLRALSQHLESTGP